MITIDAIRVGLNQGEFFLEYLPVVKLVDGHCVGAEALIRWRRPSGTVMPDQFIPLIEDTPISGLLTYWVMETIASELGEWLLAHEEAHLSFNVPPEILGRGGLEYAADKTGLAILRRQLILEVTERGLPDRLGLAALEAATQSGVRIALDDVMLGGANLAILSRCPLDIIKIDRSLVAQITADCPCPEWLGGLSALLQSTRLEVIAEGLENEIQVVALQSAGVSMAQGYYYSSPIPAEEFKRYYWRTRGQSSQTGDRS
ncbi:EAL domain-containing protein [Synechocystis salina LEGE 06099]|uniref:EAL domain-containing protein n=1 Tax=Synechocystis salina TaxID=945780 RepID=UPI00187E0C60|nr:EAL domain-containing protein [Synechocystis salina]MBE9202196.1 EAL domain-containing protein [Synechocystis salina LEGE 06099]